MDTAAGASTLVEVWPGGALVYPGASAPAGASSAITADDTPAAPAEGESASYFVTSAVVWPAGLVWSTDPDGGVAPTITATALVSLFTVGGTTRAILGATFPAPVTPDVEVTATGPTWTDDAVAGGGTWTTPTETGITYSPASGTATGGQSVTVNATAASGYTITGTASWTHAFPADTTAPVWTATLTPGTPTETAVVVTASALATDANAVTYEVSYNDGSTWAAIVPSGSNFTLAGAAGTTYATTKLRAKDAAGNYSTPALSVPSYTMAAATDVTAPTVGTMAPSAITASGFTLTVSGASDETALHAQPYAFTTDNGATWSTYQSSAVYVASGLAASTGYSCNWRVRDAAGNVSTGTAQTVTTWAPAGTLAYRGQSTSPSEVASYTYTAAPLGAESATRQVLVLVTYWSGGSRAVNSVTIGGISATRDYYAHSLSTTTGFQVWRATVPTGSTADVVAAFGSGYTAAPTLAVWTTDQPVTFLDGAFADAATGATSVSVTNSSAVSGGFAIGGQRSRSNAFDTTFTGLTERYDTGAAQPACGGDAATNGPATVTATLSVACTLLVRLGLAAYRWGA